MKDTLLDFVSHALVSNNNFLVHYFLEIHFIKIQQIS